MTEDEIKILLTDTHALALTMFAEAAGDTSEGHSSLEERVAVGCTVRNRVQANKSKRWGTGYRGVCVFPRQYSCWNPGPDLNHRRLMAFAEFLTSGRPLTDPVFWETFGLARMIISGDLLDLTNGATHYYAPAAMVPKGSKPAWVYLNGESGPEVEPAAIVGRQRFYKGV